MRKKYQFGLVVLCLGAIFFYVTALGIILPPSTKMNSDQVTKELEKVRHEIKKLEDIKQKKSLSLIQNKDLIALQKRELRLVNRDIQLHPTEYLQVRKKLKARYKTLEGEILQKEKAGSATAGLRQDLAEVNAAIDRTKTIYELQADKYRELYLSGKVGEIDSLKKKNDKELLQKYGYKEFPTPTPEEIERVGIEKYNPIAWLEKRMSSWSETGQISKADIVGYFAGKNAPIPFEVIKAKLTECCDKYLTNKIIKNLLSSQSNQLQQNFIVQKKFLMNSDSIICFIGDIHGSWHSLMQILKSLIGKKFLDKTFKIPQDKKNKFFIVFLGDYVDYGLYGVEVLYTLMQLKLDNFDNVFLIRGNHDITSACKDFVLELQAKYDQNNKLLEQQFDKLFNLFPVALYIKSSGGNDWIQCCHAGGNLGSFDPKSFLASKEECRFVDRHLGVCFVDGRIDNLGGILGEKYPINKAAIFNNWGIKAIFRGHDHNGPMLKLLLDDKHLLLPWDYVVSMIKDSTAAGGKILINNLNYPIFTFTTATEINPEVFILRKIDFKDVVKNKKYDNTPYNPRTTTVFESGYGLLRTAKDFKDWVLEPVDPKIDSILKSKDDKDMTLRKAYIEDQDRVSQVMLKIKNK
jgi:hypothetical protein